MIRITKIGGEGLIYVWAFEHGDESVSKKKFEEQDVFVPWHLNFKYEKDIDSPYTSRPRCSALTGAETRDILSAHRYPTGGGGHRLASPSHHFAERATHPHRLR